MKDGLRPALPVALPALAATRVSLGAVAAADVVALTVAIAPGGPTGAARA